MDTPTRNFMAEMPAEISEPLSEEKLTIAIIPTGQHYMGRETVEDLRRRSGNGITFYLPNRSGDLINTDEATTEITAHKEINWGYASTHSPEMRAEMLYDAIFNKKLDYIHITGGRGNEYTIIELDKLIRERKPKIDKMPIVYGMSDATNLLNYLGQKGIAKPYISTSIFEPFSFRNPEHKPKPIGEEKLRQEITRFDGKNDELEGVLIPEYLLRSYGTIQEMQLFRDKVNFLATEVHFPGEAELMMEAYKNIKPEDRKNIVFCLSAVGNTEQRHNQFKQEEQDKFKKWCIENGFRVVEGIKFGHQNDRDQYLPIPSYCECRLSDNTLQYTTTTVPLPTNPIKIEISQQGGQECNTLEFYKNYIPGGGSEVSRLIDPETEKASLIFGQTRNLKPNANGEFNVIFDSFKDRGGCPPFIYIQDLERTLKDIDKLGRNELKTINISNFDLPLEGQINPPSRKTNKDSIVEVVSYISKNYANLRDVKISINNELEFVNGRYSDKSKYSCITM